MSKMRGVQVSRPKGPFEMVEREIPEPGAGSVRIKVRACGICHSDSLTKEGYMPGIVYPRVPGHEVVGIVDAIGPGVAGWTSGQRAGLGWNGGYCGYCDSCHRGEALARVPEELSAVEAAPLRCAGITTYNCLRDSGARPGDVVAVLGLGGLGHLGVQYASKMGFKTVAIARGQDKGTLASTLGAWRYIDNLAQDPSEELQKLGGARVILATVTAGDAMAAVLHGLAVNGRLMIVGAAASLQLSPAELLGGRHSIKGWYSGTSIDSQDTRSFSVQTGVRSMNEVIPLERAGEGYERMLSGQARFRVVLTTGN